MPPPPDQLAGVRSALADGMLGFADLLIWKRIATSPNDAAAWSLAGDIALAAGAGPQALECYENAARYGLPASTQQIQLARQKPLPVPQSPGYLLIREWQAGFWSDVDHVLGQLLLAEITGRTPFVWWGAESRFASGVSSENAWERYFEPVSPACAPSVVAAASSCFPPKWVRTNLLGPIPGKWEGPWARIAAVECIAQAAPVVVSDFHSSPHVVARRLLSNHPRFGIPADALYRDLLRRYIRPQPHVRDHVAALRAQLLKTAPVIAVHIRVSDKVQETGSLGEIYRQFPSFIDAWLDAHAGGRVFLLSDSSSALHAHRVRYGSRLVHTQAARTDGAVGLHFLKEHDSARLGMEVLTDTLLAASCDAFLGCAASNVACMIARMKDWPDGACRLLGENVQDQFHTLLYQP